MNVSVEEQTFPVDTETTTEVENHWFYTPAPDSLAQILKYYFEG